MTDTVIPVGDTGLSLRGFDTGAGIDEYVRIANQPDTSLFGQLITESQKQYVAAKFVSDADVEVSTYDESSGGGSSGRSGGNLVVTSGATPGGIGARITKSEIIYTPGQEGRAVFTAIFDTVSTGCKQQVGFITPTDGAYLEKDDTGLALVHVRDSVEVSRIYSANWNGNLLTEYTKAGVVVPFTYEYGRIYRIRFGYLGYLGIVLDVISPDKQIIRAHTIYYDEEVDTLFSDTRLSFQWKSINVSSGTGSSLKAGSVNVSTVGEQHSPLISSENSTTTALGAGGVFTGVTVSHEGYPSLEIAISTDQVSATDGIELHFSDRGDAAHTDWITKTYTFNASDVVNGYKIISVPPYLSFVHVKYTNGGMAQSYLFLQLRMHSSPVELPRNGIDSDINETAQVLATRGAILAENDSELWGNITRASSGGLRVAVNQHEVDTPIKALTTYTTNQSNVGTSAVQIVGSPLTNRRTVAIKALASNNAKVYVGLSGVTTGSGFELNSSEFVIMELDETAAGIYAISGAGTQRVCWMEIGV